MKYERILQYKWIWYLVWTSYGIRVGWANKQYENSIKLVECIGHMNKLYNMYKRVFYTRILSLVISDKAISDIFTIFEWRVHKFAATWVSPKVFEAAI